MYDKDSKEENKYTIQETEITYDELGRVVRQFTKSFEDDTTDFKKSDVRFLYDLNGNLIRKWIYDDSSKTLTKEGDTTYPFVRSETQYIYDANNRILREEKSENNMVTSRVYKDDIDEEEITSALGEMTINYNENDLASKIKTPLNQKYEFTYTATELKDHIIGPRITVNMDYGYNEKMTLIEVFENNENNKNIIFSETYTHNEKEQIITASNEWEGLKSYTYTAEGFLETVKRGAETFTYTYDVNGNLLKKIDQNGTIHLQNVYGQGNRIESSIQYDPTTKKYQRVTYKFRTDGSLQQESIQLPSDTLEGSKKTQEDLVKLYEYESINLLTSITTKRDDKTLTKVEFTYDSEDNRKSKKVTDDQGERLEYYYYDTNGNLVSISEKTGSDFVDNLLNIYRDSSGQLLSFEYDEKVYDYVYNQRGDIVAITDELKEIVVKYSYDEWGNQINVTPVTLIGEEIAKINPFRYVGKYGVIYDEDTKLYFMGWRDYDSKIGRFLVADEYEGEDSNPISFNRYLYAEADPVNNIDPDGYAPKWLKKIAKGVKKAAKASYNVVIGDDIRTLTSKNTKWYQKVVSGALIAANFIPVVGPAVSVTAKVAIKGTVATVKAVKTTSSAKKVATAANKTPKTVAAKSIKSTPKIQESKSVKANNVTPQAPPKVNIAKQPDRNNTSIRLKASENATKSTGNFTNKNFASRDLLESHYEKHAVKNNEFHGAYSNADEYMQGARDVMSSGTKVGYQYKGENRTGYVRFMGNSRKGEAKFEFVGTNTNGEVTTYHVKRGEDLWKLLNNNKRDKTINPME